MSSFINLKNQVANSTLTQQSSIYALTFDELQKTLGESGKDFGSMNMDELLKNIWSSEDTQTMTPNSNYVAQNGNLQKQESLTLPRTISQKTVDEVWKDLIKENGGFKEPNLQPQENQPVLGEMTLEDFLQKAGVVSENNQTQSSWFKNTNQNHRLHQQAIVKENKNEVVVQKIIPKQAAFNFNSSLSLVKNHHMGSSVNSHSIKGMKDQSSELFQNNNFDTSPSQPSYGYGHEGGVHERKMGGSLEKVVERRRKRMIKNRESAARSRARKQAYTLELEAEVAKLKELNHELQKKQEEIMESQNFQVPDRVKFWGNKRLCLRRTLTGPW